MRNLLEYPITNREIVECLEQFKADCDPKLVGDMRPLLLDAAINTIQAVNLLAEAGVDVLRGQDATE